MTSSLFYPLVSAICIFQVEAKKKKNRHSPLPNPNQSLYEYIFIGLAIIALIALLLYLIYRRSQLMRAEKLRSIKRALEVKQQYRKNKPCTMTQMQKDEAINWFTKTSWILEESQGKQTPSKVPLKTLSVKRKRQPVDGSLQLKDYYDAFYFEMKGASSMIFGVIMFEKYYPTILFEKSVSSSKNELGTYNYTFFDGSLKKGRFEGKWYTSNDAKIEQEREAFLERERNGKDEATSERSFSVGDRSFDESMGVKSPKLKSGTFKLYHE